MKMTSTTSTNASVTMTVSTSNTIGGFIGGTSSSSGSTGVAGTGGAGGISRSVGGTVWSSSGDVSSAISNAGSNAISTGTSVGGGIIAVNNDPSGGGGSPAVSSGTSGGGGSSASSSATSGGGGNSDSSSAAIGGGGSSASSGAASGGGSSSTSSSATSGAGGSSASASSTSGGGGSSARSGAASGGGSSSASSSAASGGGGSSASSSTASVGGGNSASISGASVSGDSTAVSSGTSVGGGISAVSSTPSGGGGSSVSSSTASGGGNSSTSSSGTSVSDGSSASSSGTSVSGGSSASSSGTSVRGGSSASGGCSASSSGTSVRGGSIPSNSGGPGASVSLTCMISQNETNWYRIGSLLYNGILPAMLSVLHNDNSDPYIGLPRDPTALYNELIKRKPVIDKLAGKPSGPKIINKDQLQLIYPKTKTTDSGEFDITLTVILIRNLLKLPKPQARWDRPVKSNDSTITANVLRGQQLRNFFSHHKPNTIDTPTLDAQFAIGERILNELKYTKCDTKALKVELIDGKTYSMITSFTQKEKDRLDDLEKSVDMTKQEIVLVESRVSRNVDEVEYRVKNTEQRLDADAKQIKDFKCRIEKLEDSFGESNIGLLEDTETVERTDKTMRSKCISSNAVALETLEETSITLEDDGTSHFHFIQNTNWSIWTHHSKSSNPSEILHSFKRSNFISNEITCQLYECGYTRHYKEHEMDEHHLRKFRRLFSEDMKNQPWLLTNLHVDCVKSLQFYEFSEKLQKWCTSKEYSFMLLNYSCEEHLRMLNVNLNELRLSLQNSQLETNNEHVLVYVATDDILMSIRFVTSPGSESENKTIIEQAVLEGQNDVKLFTSLHMPICKDFNITLVSITVLNNITRVDIPESVCTKCSDTVIITQDEWMKENVLQRKLDTIVAQKRKISQENETSTHSCSVGDRFERLSSRLWGWLCTKDVYLPNLSIHGPSCLARIYLNTEQLRFMHLKQLHLMLKGPYGSGKSIMGMTKFRDLAVKATSSSRLYFICCSSNTMYTVLMKSRLHELLKGYLAENQLIVLNLDEYAEQFGLLVPLMVSDVLQDMAERHKEDTSSLGVIFDEYDASYLTEQEACLLDRALLKLEDSYILILCQSIEITREKLIKERSGLVTKKKKTLYDAFMFGSTGMQIETFNLTMRNCTRVNELSRVATQVVENTPNKYFERKAIDCKEHEHNNGSIAFNQVVRKKESYNTLSKERKEEITAVRLESGTRETSVTSDKDSQNESGNKNSPERRSEDNTLIVSGLFDHLIKNLGNTSHTCTGVSIKSMFKFPGEWLNGHSAKGDIPQIIYPFGDDDISYDNVNSFENKVRMGFALKSLIDIPTRLGNIGVICFDPIDAQIFHNLLIAMDLPVIFYTPILFPTDTVEVVPDLRECAKTHIIITDHVGAQGLELNQLIVSIDPNEKYIHQYLIEAITRCINTLFIMLISKQTEVKEHGGVCKKIVKDWIRSNSVEVSKVIFCKAHQKNDIESPVCKDEEMKKKKTYRIHQWHEDFESYTAISNCERIPIDVRRLAKMSETISNTHHVKEVINMKRVSIAIAMEKMDVESFATKYRKKELKRFRDISGNTLLDLARRRCLMDYIVWLKSIGVPGSPVKLQPHRGPPDSVTVTENNMVKFYGREHITVAAPGGAITTGKKVMYEVTFHRYGNIISYIGYIGWATPNFHSEDEGGHGDVGGCSDSYSFNPNLGKKYHNSSLSPWGIKVDGETTHVLGVAADLQNGTLLYAWDGKWEDGNMGAAFEGLPKDIVLYPVITRTANREQIKTSEILFVNFGERKFKFKPPDSSFRSINGEIQ